MIGRYPASGVRPSFVRRPSTFSNDFSSEAVGPKLLIFGMKYSQEGWGRKCVFVQFR